MNNYSHGDFFDDSDDDERQPARAAQETPMSAHDRALPKKPLSEVLGMTVEKYNKDPPCMPVVVADTRRLAKQPRRPATESGPLPSTEGDEAARTLSFANDPAGGDTPRTSPPAAAPPLPSAAAQAAVAPAAAASAANHHVGWLNALAPGPNARLAANLWTPPPESGHLIITGDARLENAFKKNYNGCAQVHKHVAKRFIDAFDLRSSREPENYFEAEEAVTAFGQDGLVELTGVAHRSRGGYLPTLGYFNTCGWHPSVMSAVGLLPEGYSAGMHQQRSPRLVHVSCDTNHTPPLFEAKLVIEHDGALVDDQGVWTCTVCQGGHPHEVCPESQVDGKKGILLNTDEDGALSVATRKDRARFFLSP